MLVLSPRSPSAREATQTPAGGAQHRGGQRKAADRGQHNGHPAGDPPLRRGRTAVPGRHAGPGSQRCQIIAVA